MDINQSLALWLNGLTHRSAIVDGAGVFLAQYLPYLLAVGFLALAFTRANARQRLLVLIEGVLAVLLSRGVVTESIRFFFYHPRPFEVYSFTPLVSASGASFTSGHAAFFFALATVIFFYNRRWGIWYFILSAFMAIARVFVGAHWPLDIVGGAAVGIICGFLVHLLLKSDTEKIYQQKTPHPGNI